MGVRESDAWQVLLASLHRENKVPPQEASDSGGDLRMGKLDILSQRHEIPGFEQGSYSRDRRGFGIFRQGFDVGAQKTRKHKDQTQC